MTESIQKEDWERFRALGRVPPSIREIVLRSWVRSRENRKIETRTHAPSLALDELSVVRSRNARLRQAARSVMAQTGYLLNDAGAMLLLCDSAGVVMDASGDARMLARGEENHLRPGGRWDENAIGTNAIGTALQMGKPVAIAGVEHFCEAIQRWSCAAAPVRCPITGTVLGAVDISGPSNELAGPVSALSVTLALQIEEAMRSLGLQEHRGLIETLLAREPGDRNDGVMLLDRYGQAIWSNTVLREAASDENDPVPQLLRESARPGDGDVRSMAERMRNALPEAGIDLLGPKGEPQGVLVTLRRPMARGVPLAARRTIPLTAIAETGPQLAEICAKASLLLESGVPILIKGAPGSGKETLAAALHEAGPQAARPFEVVDCSLLDADVLRADQANGTGFMRLAQTGGTLCLDEPGQTPPKVQSALAQVLAVLARSRSEGAALQVISLSSSKLSESMQTGELRSDLHFRLAGTKLYLPSLSERRADIPGLLRRFAELNAQAHPGRALRFTPKAISRLQAYDWPGNLREMRNLIESLAATSLSRLIDATDLPAEIAAPVGQRREDTLRQRERAAILDAVSDAGGNMTEAARRLGISRSTLYLKLDQYGLPRRRG